MDLVYIDLKHIDSDAHREFTGVPLDRILANIRKAAETGVELVVRIPVVPGVNASVETQERMFDFLTNETRVERVELLPFHRLGMTKYEGLGMDYDMSQTENMSKADCEPFAELGRAMGLTVQVGAEGS
jgi:pyruvate formate lyase activating enzyme